VVRRNIFQGNGTAGLQVNELSLPGYIGDYNLSADRYGVRTPVGIHDIIIADALFVGPAGPDGILGGVGAADDDFHLSQLAAGQSASSPAVDAGDVTAIAAGMEQLSTRTDGSPDISQVDLGYHYRGGDTQPTDKTLYVSPDGADTNTGLEPVRPLQTIGEALRRAGEGTRVQLAPGTYGEGGLRPGPRVTIIGSQSALAVIDAGGASTALDVREAGVSMTNVGITGATSAGVRVRGDSFQMMSCRVFANPDKGVFLSSGEDALIFNNLVYGNGNSGVVVGASSTSADGATIVQNTITDNGNRGITVGLSTAVPSTGAAIVNNIIAGNPRAGVEIGSGSAASLVVSHNCNSDGYSGVARPETDIAADPQLVASTGGDDMFFLSQVAAGQGTTSPCVDVGLASPRRLGLQATTTRTDGRGDTGTVDIGYHHQLPDLTGISLGEFVRSCAEDCGEKTGDCSGDGQVTVDELVLGVAIALGGQPAAECPSLDADGDGQVTVDELLTAVRNALDG
jgi:hypothetical protein